METKINQIFYHPKLTRFLKENSAYIDYIFNLKDYSRRYPFFKENIINIADLSNIMVIAFNWSTAERPFKEKHKNGMFWSDLNHKWSEFIENKKMTDILKPYFNKKLLRFLKERGAYAHYVFNTFDYFNSGNDVVLKPERGTEINYAFIWGLSKYPKYIDKQIYWMKLHNEWKNICEIEKKRKFSTPLYEKVLKFLKK